MKLIGLIISISIISSLVFAEDIVITNKDVPPPLSQKELFERGSRIIENQSLKRNPSFGIINKASDEGAFIFIVTPVKHNKQYIKQDKLIEWGD